MPKPKITITIMDVELRRLIDETSGKGPIKVVADGVEYGINQEYGVENGFGRGIRIPAHPFMVPAVEAVRPGFMQAFKGCITNEMAEIVVRTTAFKIERLAKANAPVDTGALKNTIHVVDGDITDVEFKSR